MPKANVTIVGLGFVGSSMGLALKKSGADISIIGHDKEPEVAREALKMKAVDRTDWNLISACEKADVVILALPFQEMRETMKAVGPYLKPGCLVTDTAIPKRPVMKWAEEFLPEHVSFVGGNPIISPQGEAAGVKAASAEVLKGATYCLTPSPQASGEAVELTVALVKAMGANPYFLDPAEHDGLLAGIEQLPIIAAAALMGTLSQSPPWRDMRRLGGSAFSQGTASLWESRTFWAQPFLENADNLIRWVDQLIYQLETLKRGLQEQDEEVLSTYFGRAIAERERWYKDKTFGQWEEVPEPPRPPGMLETFLGIRLRKPKE
jgi:prephenate dehydrogenase